VLARAEERRKNERPRLWRRKNSVAGGEKEATPPTEQKDAASLAAKTQEGRPRVRRNRLGNDSHESAPAPVPTQVAEAQKEKTPRAAESQESQARAPRRTRRSTPPRRRRPQRRQASGARSEKLRSRGPFRLPRDSAAGGNVARIPTVGGVTLQRIATRHGAHGRWT